jgi:hypothetical protein
MIPVGQHYRASGPINLRLILSTLILGTVTACAAALAVWAWESSPIPTLLILTPILQGLLIGVVLGLVIGRLKLRNVFILSFMGFICGLTSVGLVHVGHHIRFVKSVVEALPGQLQSDETITPEQKAQMLAFANKEPYKFVDQILKDQTDYPGLAGSLIWRAQQGVEIKNTRLEGWAVGVLWGIEALMVAGAAAYMAKNRAAKPFCEDCDEWCVEKTGGIILSDAAGPPLASVLTNDDPAGFVALRDKALPFDPKTRAGTTLHSCPGCDQTFADVWVKIEKTKGNKTETTTKAILTHVRVSPEMLELLRNEKPAEPLEEGEGAGEEAESETETETQTEAEGMVDERSSH